MKKERKIKNAFFLILMTLLGCFAMTDEGSEYFEHIRDTRIIYGVTQIKHPLNASQGDSVEFVIYTVIRCYQNVLATYCKIRSNFILNTISGDFYWYEEPGIAHFAISCDFVYKFSHVFFRSGTWTIDINGYTTSITIF